MRFLKDLLIGAVIGAANIIPGVSGGTMALILGIYERLLGIISSISAHSIKSLLGIVRFNQKAKQEFIEEFNRLEGFFLIKLAIGALLAILSLASIMTFLLKEFHDPTYGFFFGLVAVSAVYPYKLIKQKNISIVAMFVIGCISVMAISNSVSNEDLINKAKAKQEIKLLKKSKPSADSSTLVEKRNHQASYLFYVFILGAVSITAMVLPGISGSFLLLLLGGYFELLKAIAIRDLLLLGVFAFGCLIGLLISTRIIQKLLEKWHDATMGFLLGLVIGSLWMIWPFKESRIIGDETIYLNNVLPTQVSNNEVLSLSAIMVGALLVAIFLFIEHKNKKS